LLSVINSYQEDFFIKNNFFSNSFKDLKMGIYQAEDQWYRYSIRATNRSVFIYLIPKKPDLKSHVGVVLAVSDADEKLTFLNIRCKTKSFGIVQLADPLYQAGKLACGEGTEIDGVKTPPKRRYDGAGRLIETIYFD
jgi:hypothetical protein